MEGDGLNPRKRRHGSSQDPNPDLGVGSMNMNADDDNPQLSSNPQIPRELVSVPDVNPGIGCSSDVRSLNPQSANREANSGVSGQSRNSRHVHRASSMNTNADTHIPQLSSNPQIPRELVSAPFQPSTGSDVNLGIGCSSNLSANRLPGESSRNAPLAAQSLSDRTEVEHRRQRTSQAPTNPSLAIPLPPIRHPFPSNTSNNILTYMHHTFPPRQSVAYIPPLITQTAPQLPLQRTANSTFRLWRPPHEIRVEGIRCFWCKRDLTSAPQGLSYHPASVPTPFVVMSCGHAFHEDCLRAHVSLHAIAPTPQSPCPICRGVPGP